MAEQNQHQPAAPAPAQQAQPTRGATPGQAPGQATRPAEQPNLLATAEQPGAAEAGPSGLTRDEEAELARLQDKAARHGQQGGTVRMRVTGDHESMTHAHLTVGRDWTEVPTALSGAMSTAAADAGVQIEQEEG